MGRCYPEPKLRDLDTTPTKSVTQVVRLTPEMMEALERQLPPPIVQASTTDLQAGYSLGIQFVLTKLRDGFAVPA